MKAGKPELAVPARIGVRRLLRIIKAADWVAEFERVQLEQCARR